MTNSWQADPHLRGNGARVLEIFLEPTRPYSINAFGKLDELLGQANEDRTPELGWH